MLLAVGDDLYLLFFTFRINMIAMITISPRATAAVPTEPRIVMSMLHKLDPWVLPDSWLLLINESILRSSVVISFAVILEYLVTLWREFTFGQLVTDAFTSNVIEKPFGEFPGPIPLRGSPTKREW